MCVRDGTDLVDSDIDPLIGRPLDRYVVEEKLGEGGMGCVYRARHTVLDREYAIKVLFADFATDERFLARFRREAQSMSKLRHENIVNVEDFGTSPQGQTFLAMELVRGQTLEQIIEREAPLPPPRAARIARQMAAGLGSAHAGGFVHRDIKPSNVMIERRGNQERVKILDFGAVNLQSIPTSDRLTHVGHIIGTPTYMAPEQSQDPNVGPTADLYALGVVLYEMLDGNPPFTGVGRAEVLVKHITSPAPTLPPKGGLERLVAKLLEKHPHARPQDARAVVAMLDDLGLDGPDNEETAVTPLELSDLRREPPPTPPTQGGETRAPESLRQLYQELQPPGPEESGNDLLGQDTFPSLAPDANWDEWSSSPPVYRSLDAETDEVTQGRKPLVASDLVLEPPAMAAAPRAASTGGHAAFATEIVRDRVVPNSAAAEITDPVEMFREGPAPMAPSHESDDGGPTQVDFDIEPFGSLPAPESMELTPPDPRYAPTAPQPIFEEAPADPPLLPPEALQTRPPSTIDRPIIQTEVSDLSPDTSATVVDGDEPDAMVPLAARASDVGLTPLAPQPPPAPGPSFSMETLAPADPDEIPTSESPPPWESMPPTNLGETPATTPAAPSTPKKSRLSPVYYLVIVALALVVAGLAWILLTGDNPFDATSALTIPPDPSS